MLENEIGVVLVTLDGPAAELAATVQKLGGYGVVEVGCLGGGGRGLREAVEQVMAGGAERVLLIPTLTAGSNGRYPAAIAEELAAQRAAHPGIEFINASTPLDAEHHAHLLVCHLQQFEDEKLAGDLVPLSLLSAHQSGTVQTLKGGHEFVSRLAALGFIPGSPVEVVQNYGLGPLIVTIRDTRIALGREEARKVRVRPANGDERQGRPQPGRRHHRRRGHFE